MLPYFRPLCVIFRIKQRWVNTEATRTKSTIHSHMLEKSSTVGYCLSFPPFLGFFSGALVCLLSRCCTAASTLWRMWFAQQKAGTQLISADRRASQLLYYNSYCIVLCWIVCSHDTILKCRWDGSGSLGFWILQWVITESGSLLLSRQFWSETLCHFSAISTDYNLWSLCDLDFELSWGVLASNPTLRHTKQSIKKEKKCINNISTCHNWINWSLIE